MNLALHIYSIIISINITNLSKEHNRDNVTYMLCMLIGTLLGGCFTSMIKCQMFVLEIQNLWDKKQGQMVVGIYLC